MGTARSKVESESNKCEGDGGVCDEAKEDSVAKGKERAKVGACRVRWRRRRRTVFHVVSVRVVRGVERGD